MLPALVPLSRLLRSVHRQSPAAQTQPAVQAIGPISWRAPLLLQWLLHPSARMNLPRCETDLDPSLSRHGGLHVALGVAHSPCCTGASQALPCLARLPPQSPFSLLATDRHCEALLHLTAQPVHTVLPLPAASSPPPHPELTVAQTAPFRLTQTESEEPPWAPVPPCSPHEITCGPM